MHRKEKDAILADTNSPLDAFLVVIQMATISNIEDNWIILITETTSDVRAELKCYSDDRLIGIYCNCWLRVKETIDH